ncbi:MAG: class I SAM-dependent methyltransferase [Gammaproteobacteria bacterium]
MKAALVPRIPEIALAEFDADYRRAEIEHSAELETTVVELENAARAADMPACDLFTGAHRTLLDVGCGIGTVPFLFARNHPDATVIGVDINADSIAYAREHYGPQAANLSYQTGRVEDLGEHFRNVDLVICVGALHHFPDLRRALDQIMGVLADDGMFLLSDLNRENIHAHFSADELKRIDAIRKLADKPRYNRLKRQGYLTGKKMRRLLTLMSFQAAYTPAEIAQTLGSAYAFKGRMSGLNYILAAYRKTAASQP